VVEAELHRQHVHGYGHDSQRRYQGRRYELNESQHHVLADGLSVPESPQVVARERRDEGYGGGG